MKENTSLAAKGALANRLQRRTAWKSNMAARGPKMKKTDENSGHYVIASSRRRTPTAGTPHARANIWCAISSHI